MQEISIEKIMEKAEIFHKGKRKWHFHMLTPNCMFNKRNKHAIILENETDSQSFVTYSDKQPTKKARILVKMLHGGSVISGDSGEERRKKDDENTETENMQTILKKAMLLNEKGVSWHHHVLFPNCMFNKNKGRWCIVFEDTETGKVMEYVSFSEPKENLKKIEALFYAQKGQ